MKANTVRDLGALVRSARRAQGLTQADLAKRLGVSRDWVVRLEQGHPRLEAQRVLDALVVLGLTLDVAELEARPAPRTAKKVTGKTHTSTKPTARSAKSGRFVTSSKTLHAKSSKSTTTDPFDTLFKGL